MARSFFSVWIPRSTTAVALRSSGRFVRCTASAGSSRSSVANSLPRSVVTTKFLSSPVSSCVARLVARPTVSAFLFCRGSTAASRVNQAILRLPPRVLAEVDEVGLQPVVRPLGGRLAQRTRPWRLHLPAHVGLQRLEGHGLRHVKVALPRKSVQLPRVPHVEVVGQVPQRLHVYLFFGPRCACQASSASSRAWKLLHTPHSTLVRRE